MRLFEQLMEYDEELRYIVSTAEYDREIQGIIPGFDQFWINAMRLAEVFGDEWLIQRLYETEFPRIFSPDYRYDRELYLQQLVDYHLNTAYWLPKQVYGPDAFLSLNERLKGEFRYLPPMFILKICLLPSSQYRERRNNYQTVANGQVRIVEEVRPTARLWAADYHRYHPLIGGINIGTSDGSGTLGGILRGNDNAYAITCSHVVGDAPVAFQPQIGKRRARPVGQIVYRSDIRPLDPNDFDNRRMVDSNLMDLAVIALDEQALSGVKNLGAVNGLLPDHLCGPNRPVLFNGFVSGLNQQLRYDTTVYFYDLDYQGQRYRFRDLMQVELNGYWNRMFNPAARGGDSGSWLCTPDGAGLSWCGMIIGGFEQKCFAIPAESILEEVRFRIGPNININ